MMIPNPSKYINTVRKIIISGFFSFDILNITRLSAAAILFQLSYDKKAMKKSITVITSVLFCVLCFLPHQLHADEVFKSFLIGRFDLNFDTNYLKTKANFDLNGENVSLPVNSSLQLINLKTQARYLFFKDLGFYSGLNFNNIESFNGTNTRSNSVLTHFFFGSDYQIIQAEKWSLYADVSYYLSNVAVNLNQDDALPSDGASEIKALLVGTINFEKLRSFAKAGIDQRSDGLSTLLLYGTGLEFFVGYYSALGFEINGASTIKDDINTDTALVRDTLTDRVNGGSRLFYSINPNVLDAQLSYAYRSANSFTLKLSVGSTLKGSNTAEAGHVGLSASWSFGNRGIGKSQFRKSKKPTDSSIAISDEDPGFKIDTDDGVNQELFKPVEPVKPK